MTKNAISYLKNKLIIIFRKNISKQQLLSEQISSNVIFLPKDKKIREKKKKFKKKSLKAIKEFVLKAEI